MATKTITQVFDDIDGTEGAQTVKFGLGGVHWTIDLSDKNREKLEKALQPFLEKASPDQDTARALRTGKPAAAVKAASGDSDVAALRAYAIAHKMTYNGKPIGKVGKLAESTKQEIRDAMAKGDKTAGVSIAAQVAGKADAPKA